MTDATNDNAINIDDTIARLAEIEAERETLLERLRSANGAINEVLSCYAPPVEAKTRKPRAPKADAPAEAPKKRGRPRKTAPNGGDFTVADGAS